MHSPPNPRYQTARKTSTQKSARRFPPARYDCARWARDPYNHVTSTMSNTAPYDHTTHPASPRTNIQSQTPRPDTKSPAIVDPRQTSPAAACPPTPRLAPREGRKVARDGPHRTLRKSATFPGSFPSAYLFSKAATQIPLDTHKPTPPTPPTPREQLMPEQDKALLRHITPLKLPTIKNPAPAFKGLTVKDMKDLAAKTSKEATVKTTKEATAKPQAPPPKKVHMKVPDMPVRRKRRPSEIFNMSFSFATPSRRRPSDRTPQISPRSSISSECAPTITSEKRQRVDSSGTNTTLAEDLASFPFIHTSTDAHPGLPVDFSSARVPARPKEEQEFEYHTYLDEARRLDPRPCAPVKARVLKEDKEETLGKEARILGLSSNVSKRERAARKDPPPAPTKTISYASSSNTSQNSRRTSSDSSTERFLTHVRASQEARAASNKKGNTNETNEDMKECVFRNEREKGWFDLSEKPL